MAADDKLPAGCLAYQPSGRRFRRRATSPLGMIPYQHLILKARLREDLIDVAIASREAVMDSVELNGRVAPCVEVVESGGEWFVRVVDGDEELSRSFMLESFALAFAEAQRIRLGLDEFEYGGRSSLKSPSRTIATD